MNLALVDKMLAHCREQQVKQNTLLALVTFKVPQKAIRARVRLLKDRGPFGDVAQTSETGTVAKFRADLMIEFLEKERSRELSRQLDVAKQAATK